MESNLSLGSFEESLASDRSTMMSYVLNESLISADRSELSENSVIVAFECEFNQCISLWTFWKLINNVIVAFEWEFNHWSWLWTYWKLTIMSSPLNVSFISGEDDTTFKE